MKFVESFKQAVFVASLNLIFFIEFTVAINIRSVSLIADSIDFIEDASINFLIFAVSLTKVKKAKISIILSFVMMFPGLIALWAVWQQIILQNHRSNRIVNCSISALIVNCLCTLILMKFQDYSGSLISGISISKK